MKLLLCIIVAFSLSFNLYAQDYCTASGQITNHEWIDYVQFAGMNNTSGNDGGYADFTDNYIANVYTNSSVYLRLRPGIDEETANPDEYWRVWIDFNQDMDFNDPNEMVYSSNGATSANIQTQVEIPYYAAEGITRMRVIMKFVNPDNPEPTPCDDFLYGEVEDYSVNIQDPPVNPNSLAVLDNSQLILNAQNGTLSFVYPENYKNIKIYKVDGKLLLNEQIVTSEIILPKNIGVTIVVIEDNQGNFYTRKIQPIF